MKTIVIIISVLAVMTVVYGYNEERSEKFLRNLSKCEKSPTRLQGGKYIQGVLDLLETKNCED
ncbi:hypothetical protein EAI_02992 [Harpegnathos saltator]|uniref:Uncharacterized protein n=1 Tax=Harpegnathos saltator TaxID=610380 RepID=E2BF50_HARSA|nr:hypothetical protein EAI_02992 [Harpegnathos saltator]